MNEESDTEMWWHYCRAEGAKVALKVGHPCNCCQATDRVTGDAMLKRDPKTLLGGKAYIPAKSTDIRETIARERERLGIPAPKRRKVVILWDEDSEKKVK